MNETGCQPTTSNAKLRFDSVDFSDIPGQSKLFLQYQSDPLSLKKFYPSAVSCTNDLTLRRSEVLEKYVCDRDELCDILADQNSRFGAGPLTFEHIQLLRRSDTVAIVTGQQAGLFTGPLYTIYKALSAIKMASCLAARGIDAVPVFWAATEDHDFDEISRAFLKVGTGTAEISLPDAETGMGQPVGQIRIPDGFASVLREQLPDDLNIKLRSDLERLWAPGQNIGEAFCSHIQQIFRDYGLIVVDPMDPRLKKLAAPIYSNIAENAAEVVSSIVDRSAELEAAGFHSQVLVTSDYYPLFYHTDDGVRRSVRRAGERLHVSDAKVTFSSDAEVAKIALADPERFSPGVMVRPVVQDYLFPTLCYFGGGAEIAYFAQNSAAYRVLRRPVTPILHRQSFSLIEPRDARAMRRYEIGFRDLFRGFEKIRGEVVDRFVNPTAARLFADAEENINTELHRLDEEMSRIDPTLSGSLATRRRKIIYHIGALRQKFRRVQLERDETANRRLRSLFASMLPEGGLQERSLNIVGFQSAYGGEIVNWIYDSIDLDERGHRLLYL